MEVDVFVLAILVVSKVESCWGFTFSLSTLLVPAAGFSMALIIEEYIRIVKTKGGTLNACGRGHADNCPARTHIQKWSSIRRYHS